MKVEEREGARERLVLTGMVTDDRVLAKVAARWEEGGLFAAEWSNLVGGWCVDYHRKHGAAPKGHVKNLFAAWAERRREDAEVRSIDSFLAGLSDEYERGAETNTDYVVDEASRHFRLVKLTQHRDQLTGHLDNSDLEGGEACAQSFRKMQMGQDAWIDVFNDEEAIKDVFAQEDAEDLVTYPGDLGDFFRGLLVRDAFVAFNGPEKGGKSYWLLDLAYRAVTADRRRVAFFEVGDMSQRQVMKRLLCRAALHPTRSTDPEGTWPCKVKVPTRIIPNPDREPPYQVTHKEVVYGAPLDRDTALKKVRSIVQTRVRASGPYFRLSVHPCQSISARGIRDVLHEWEDNDGWVPDVVCIDYADLLNPIDPKKDVWHATDQTWGSLRGLSQEKHVLVVTATQADAASYDVVTQSRKNFGWCKGKMAHATVFFGINVIGAEKERGLGRLNQILAREGFLPSSRCVTYASCLARAQVAVKSSW